VDPAEAASSLRKAAEGIRAAEVAAIEAGGMSPTPFMVAASLDFEMLKGGAIAGVELQPESYSQAFEALKGYLALFADSPEIGMFDVEWHPGSISSEATDKLPELVRGLLADVQGKLIVLTTGASTGFKPHEDQSRYYALAFANLADLRAAEGVDSPFIGILWNSALDGAGANEAPPSDQTLANVGAWDFSAKAAELVQALQTGGGDPDLMWWWNKTRASFGILTSDGGAPKQAHEVLVELQSATAQAAVETGVAETVEKLQDAQANAIGQADPNTGLPIDPNTGQPIDPNTGLPIDPNTGQPIDPNGVAIDPNTGLPVDPNAGGASNPVATVADELKNTLNGALSQLLGAIIEKGKSGLTNLIGRLLGEPSLGGTPGFDPGAGGGTVDPATGFPIDPNTGFPIDPNTGQPIDPSTGQPVGGGDPGGTGGTGGDEPGRAPGDPGGAGGADLAFEGAVSVPTSMTTNDPVAITVTMRNNGSVQAEGATAYLMDGEGNAFAASDMTTVAPGASANATITFTPPSAGAIPGVKVLLFADNEANPGDNEQNVGSVSISDPAGGVDEGIVDEPGLGGEEPEGGSPGGGSPGGGRPGGGVRPGGGGIRVPGIKIPPRLIGIRPALGLKFRPPGMVPKLTKIKPGMFNVGAIVPGSSAKLLRKESSLFAGPGEIERPVLGYPAGLPLPLNVTISNPFRRAFTNVRATLFVNGRAFATRNLGTLMPKQSRTVAFSEFKPSGDGKVSTEVRFEANGLKGRAMQGRAGGDVNALDPKAARPILRPALLPSAGAGAATAAGGARPAIKTARPIGGLVPTVVKTTIHRPTLAPMLQPTAPAGGKPTRPLTIGVARTTFGSSVSALAVGTNDIGIAPFPPAPGGQVAVSVRLLNRGGAPARGVKVEVFLDGKSLKSQTLDVPAGQQAVASQFDRFAASLGAHELKAVVTAGGQAQEVVRAFEVKSGVRLLRPSLSFASKGAIVFSGNDIQFSPLPQPGKPTSIAVNVRNPGAAPAQAEFEAFVGGQSMGKLRRTLAPLQSASVSGFSSWTPPAGAHTVRIVGTVDGRQIQAEKSVNVTATLPTRPILRNTGSAIRFDPLRPGGGAPIGSTGRPPIGGTTPVGPVRPLIGAAPDLGVTVADLSLSPPSPRQEQPVTIHVKVRNSGGADAQGGMLTLSYQVDRETPKTMTLPVNVGKGQELPRAWQVRLGKGSKLTVTARVTHPQDRNNANSTASMTVDLATGGSPVTPGIRIPPGGIRPPVGGTIGRPETPPPPDVALAASDITFSPSTVREGNTLTFRIKLRNVGQGEAKGAKLSLTLNKDGVLHETKEMMVDLPAGQTVEREYRVTVPRARQLQLTAAFSHPQDRNAGNQQASVNVNVALPLTIRPPIGLPTTPLPGAPVGLAPELALGPGSVAPGVASAKVGDNLPFKVKVTNTGRGAARGAELTVRFFVDGREVGRPQTFRFDLDAGRTFERTVVLRVPPGRRAECRASVSASGDANSGNNTGVASLAIG
jgi:hypothetical protein